MKLLKTKTDIKFILSSEKNAKSSNVKFNGIMVASKAAIKGKIKDLITDILFKFI